MAPKTGFASAFVTVAFFVAGCAGAGGAAPISGSGNLGTPRITPEQEATAGSDTGSSGPIQAPTSAVWGSSAPQYAMGGSPSFLSGTPPLTGSFPVLATGLQFTTAGVSPVSIGSGAMATVTGLGTDVDGCVPPGTPAANIQLVIPGANVNDSFQLPLSASAFGFHAPSYVHLGLWGFSNTPTQAASGNPLIEYLFGYETPPSAIPATGQASFVGGVSGWVFAPINGRVTEAYFGGGVANFSVDFASGNLTGALTGIKHSQALGPVLGAPWNDVSISASIAAGSNRFSGSTAVTSVPVSESPYILSGSATGHINGALFGPAAQEIGALWTLSDGTAAAIGTVYAGR